MQLMVVDLQEYFFPKTEPPPEGAPSKRQQTWVKSVDAKLKSRKSSSAVSSTAGSEAAAAELPPHELAAVKLGRPDGTKSAVHTPHIVPSVSGIHRLTMSFEV